MAVQNRDQIGWIDCPMCQSRATVHQCAIGRGKNSAAKYWRCDCGTIQPWKPKGQSYIHDHMQAIGPVANPNQIDLEDQIKASDPPPVKPKKSGFLDFLMSE